MCGNRSPSRTSGPSIRVCTSRRSFGERPGSNTRMLPTSMEMCTAGVAESSSDPSASGASITWSSANARNNPDLNTRTVTVDRFGSRACDCASQGSATARSTKVAVSVSERWSGTGFSESQQQNFVPSGSQKNVSKCRLSGKARSRDDGVRFRTPRRSFGRAAHIPTE